ncbi:MAG: N-6 DNA methylase [Saprospiraceae bacterium]|nr:N-6 DNA methylase [Saprospiraceae bacterium]
MSIIKEGIKKKLIKISNDQQYITYVDQKKKRNFQNPEEKVQAVTFLSLVLVYKYPAKRIKQFVSVPMGRDKREADIIVYKDDACNEPFIVVECKKEEVSEMEFIQSIRQAASYAYAIPGTIKFIWITSGIKNEYFFIDKESSMKQSIPDLPKFGIDKIKKYKYVKGGKLSGEEAGDDEVKQNYFDLAIIDEDELTKRFKQAHNALWAGGELNPSEAFDELDKLIFCKIWDEKKPRKPGEPYYFQLYKEPVPKGSSQEELERIENKMMVDLFDRISDLYEEGKTKDPEVFRDNIRLNYYKVKTVVSYLEGVNLSETDLDSKGKAFETFMGSYFRGDFGQYFTPRAIVKFIVNCLPIRNDSKVLDTSCGSGGFLLYALDKVRNQASDYYPDWKRSQKRYLEHYKFWHDFAQNNLFGIEINEQIARTAKMNMIIHDDGHTNVIASDGLLSDEVVRTKSNNDGFKYGTFDFIITNPPFGSSVKQTEKAYLHNYGFGMKDVSWLDYKNSSIKGRSSQSTEVLFIEQCWNYLKPGGFLAIVIPDGILTNSSMQYVRDNIEEWYRIVAVVSMPQTAFAHTGAGVKSSVLFLRKWDQAITERIQYIKKDIQEQIKLDADYIKKVDKLEKEKRKIIKEHIGFENTTNETEKKGIEKTEEFQEWKKEITSIYNQKINDLKDDLADQYIDRKHNKLDDYSIFMAIAEDIGYDATNRPTGNNELEKIEIELIKFIKEVTIKEL